MDQQYYLNLAASGLKMPIGTDLALHEQSDVPAIIVDGERLGKVLEIAANNWKTPLAFTLMDLTLEKDLILSRIGIPADQREQFHFSTTPSPDMLAKVAIRGNYSQRIKANLGALTYVATKTKLVPVGMTIGPFSLMTKLLSDPITPVFMAGSGTKAEEDPEVQMVETILEMGCQIILESMEAQAKAGAKAIIIAEPAANKAYFSPIQLDAGSDIFKRYVISFNKRIADRIRALGMDLLFHCCGELTDGMVKDFTTLEPRLLSLGSSRKLWEDAAIVPKNIVLFGNLPTKKFYSDSLITAEQAATLSRELLANMRKVGHPFILGSECDVLSVPGASETIKNKIYAMLNV